MAKKIFYCSSINKCDLNSYSGNIICNFLEKNGFILLSDPAQADIIIINTCGFDQAREDISLSLIDNYIDKYLKIKQMIICGCLPKINPSLNKSKDILKNIILIGPKELHKFNEIFSPKIPIENIKPTQIKKDFFAENRFKKDNYHILICEGCLSNCSYCAIKKAKGSVQSESLDTIVKEFNKGLGLGFKNFVLLGDDCGSYGLDIKTDLAELLNKIVKIKGDYKITIYYLEPFRLENIYSKINKNVFRKIRTICLPIQSVNQRIIGLMNRRYNIESIFNIAKQIKKDSSSIFLRTHIIYNFPTETKQEFMNNINHPDLKYFNEVMLFCYSDRKGTKAAELKGKIAGKERQGRIKIVKQLLKNNTKFTLPSKIGLE